MSDYNTNPAARYGTARARVEVDAGLRAYMLRVYNYMALGLAITGAAALGIYMLSVATDPATAVATYRGIRLTALGAFLFSSWFQWVVIFAPLAFVLVLSFGIQRLSVGAAQALFWIYAALVGVSFAVLLMVYSGQSVARTFFVTAAAFGALSLYGYTTRRDLSGFGSFLIMGLFGIIIASVVNIFLASSMLQFIVSVVGVLVFAGLTAYDTQRLKNDYINGYASQGGDVAERAAITGALSLYLNFINLFTLLLQLLGQRD